MGACVCVNLSVQGVYAGNSMCQHGEQRVCPRALYYYYYYYYSSASGAHGPAFPSPSLSHTAQSKLEGGERSHMRPGTAGWGSAVLGCCSEFRERERERESCIRSDPDSVQSRGVNLPACHVLICEPEADGQKTALKTFT